MYNIRQIKFNLKIIFVTLLWRYHKRINEYICYSCKSTVPNNKLSTSKLYILQENFCCILYISY